MLSNNKTDRLLFLCADIFKRFNSSLIEHLYFEEKNLFIYSKYLHNAYHHNWNKYLVMNYINLYSIDDFQDAHPKTEQDLELMINLLDEYSPGRSYKLTYNIIMYVKCIFISHN